MAEQAIASRREVLMAAGALAAGAGLSRAAEPVAPPAAAPGKVYRIGVLSAAIRGKAQKANGHTWHFAQYLHPEIDMAAIRKYQDPGSAKMYEKYSRNPRYSFDQLPFPDTRLTHIYGNPPDGLSNFCEAFPGVKIAASAEELAESVDAVWLGDASGYGEDHFDLIAPALKRGLPCFCDKPIGASVAGTRKILEFAKANNAPLMSSSLFRHEFGMEQALRMRDSGDFGPIEFVLATTGGGYTADRWAIYGQHPVWTVMTLMGPGAQSVSMHVHGNSSHTFITYPDRNPAEVWQGQSADSAQYCHTSVYFAKQLFQFTPAMEGDFWFGHHYEMFRMAATFREMVKTRKEPVPHREILEVTAIIHAGLKSLAEKNRPVALAEVLDA